MKTFALALFALTIISCNNKSAGNQSVTDADTIARTDKATASPIHECYEFVQQKDTISLSLDRTGDYVKGGLRFKNFEKDSSFGEILGQFSGDTLKLDYTFQSEGTTSRLEMRLLKSGNSLLMGTGDMEEQDGKMVFKNPKGVKYEKSIVLVKTECE